MNKQFLIGSIIAGGILFFMVVGAALFHDRILPRTFAGAVPLGGLTRAAAAARLGEAIAQVQHEGIHVVVDGTPETIMPDAIGFDVDIEQAVDAAFARGHADSIMANMGQTAASLWHGVQMEVPIQVDENAVHSQLDQIASTVEVPRQDVRLSIHGTSVRLLTDIAPGRVINRANAIAAITHALETLNTQPITLTLSDDLPVASASLAPSAVVQAQKMVSRGLSLTYEDFSFYISPSRIGSWIISQYDGPQLKASLDRVAIATYVTGIARAINIAPVPPQIATTGDQVTGFTPPKVGRAVQEDLLIDQIIATITSRTGTDKMGDTMVIPMKTTKMAVTGLNTASGITELIGKATTPFTGSPKNRISNIKNGVKFLSGAIVQPGDEFSTLGTLGAVDNTTGYLPELVIKGDHTEPDFGGGLCQVSTTLFRAVMNAGLPITARRNHSYRVSYYEKDGDGNKIGPGLDATIFEPNPDFRFRNDMTTPVLIIGYVIGDKLTFELYGTRDGRSSAIDGPHLLTETPSGDPIYTETSLLPKGVTKQTETPHPGGTAVATYTITYADGHKAKQVFNSFYRPWPAQYLIGTNPNCSTAAQCATISTLLTTPTPTISPLPAPQKTP